MNDTDPWLQPAWAVILSILLSLCALLVRPCTAEADAVDAVQARLAKEQGRIDDPALLLARAIVGEASLRATQDEARAIGYVLGERGMFYSAVLRTCRQKYVCELTADGAKPPSWPENMAWDYWRPRFLRIYEYAQEILAGEVEHMCEPDHFGSFEDAQRAWNSGWRPVFCGRTANYFWRVPTRAERDRLACLDLAGGNPRWVEWCTS